MRTKQMDTDARITIATVKLEELVTGSVLFEKYAKVVEDPSVVVFIARLAVRWAPTTNEKPEKWLAYTVHIESKDRIIEQSGPRKDWRNILDKALTMWIEDAITDIDPL